MRAAFVLAILVIALILGTVAGLSGSRGLTRVLIVGVVPAIWGVAHVVERLIGREIWRFSAPYPDRRMRERGETALPPSNPVRRPVEASRRDAGGSILPLAA